MQSATLLAYHRPGGLHRLMLAVASRTAHIRRFCAIPHRSSAPIGTAQSRRDVSSHYSTDLHQFNIFRQSGQVILPPRLYSSASQSSNLISLSGVASPHNVYSLLPTSLSLSKCQRLKMDVSHLSLCFILTNP